MTMQRRGKETRRNVITLYTKKIIGEEYSSNVYYITIIRVLLFYDNGEKILQNDK